MALQDIVNISISLETTGVTRAGFGTAIFIGSHRHFPERIRTYTSLTAVAVDCPSGTNEYAAATALFGQDVAPPSMKIGRREADVTLTPDLPALDDVFTVVVTDTDGDSIIATYTAIALDTEEDVVDGIKAVIDGDPNVSVHVTTAKVGTGAAAVLNLSPTAGADVYTISGLVKLTDTYTTSEDAPTALAAIEAIDSDFYFITTHERTEVFVLAMAATVEAKSKMYFLGSQDQDSLATIATPATDTLGKLFDLNYYRTVGIYHQDADANFTECAYVGNGAPTEPGTITWANRQLNGVSTSKTSGGIVLSATQQQALASRNVNFIQNVGGVDITRQGKVMKGEWIDVIRSRDLIEARVTEAYQTQLINSPKIPYTNSGINSLYGTLSGVLSRYVSTNTKPNILDEYDPFTITFARAEDVSFADKSARTFNGSFTANLAGAIHIITITGALTYQGSA